MNQRPMLAIAMALIVLDGCASSTASPGASAPAVATSFEEYAIAFCSAFESMFRAVGNPDTGSGSVLSTSLDAAVAAGDVASAERLAATITSELEAGRQHVAIAAGWEPARPVMAQLDRVFAAFEVMIAAKRAAASHAPNEVIPQTAFEQAGGAEAWFAMFEAGRAMQRANGTPDHHCPTIPVGT